MIDPPIRPDVVLEIRPDGYLNFICNEEDIDNDTAKAMNEFARQVSMWLVATRH